MKLELFRLLPAPPENQPFSVRSAGRHQFERGAIWRYPTNPRDVIQFFWISAGRGRFHRAAAVHRLEAGMICWYLPGEIHNLSPLTNSPLDHCWFTLDGPLAAALIEHFHFSDMPAQAGNCPVWLFERLFQRISDITPAGLHDCATIAFEILSMARAGLNTVSPYPTIVYRCLELIKQEFTSPELNVNALADALRVNRSILSRLFHKVMNTTLIDYLTLTRIHYARTLLQTGKFTSKEIAHKSGFTSASYFTGRFAKHYGLTPLAWLKTQCTFDTSPPPAEKSQN